ncbi:MAG TPA: hypothetical protein VH500_23795 [Nitrososphaeraceae archaeon]
MIAINRREKEKLVVELYENGSSYHEIAKEARVSLRDIKGILDRASGVHIMSKSSQAYQMFSEGKSPTEVAIALDMREHEITQLYRESWTLKQLYDLNSIYLETNGDLWPFVKLYKLSIKAGLNAEHVARILKLSNDDLLHLQSRYYSLKSEVKSLESKKNNLVRIMHEYENQVIVLGRSFDNYCRLCTEEEFKLNELERKKSKAEALVSHLENNDKNYLKIRKVIEEKVKSALSDGMILLKLAVYCVLQSIKMNSEQYVSLPYDSFSSRAYNLSSYPDHINNMTLEFESMLVNNAAKVYDKLAKNLINEFLDKYDVDISQSSLALF